MGIFDRVEPLPNLPIVVIYNQNQFTVIYISLPSLKLACFFIILHEKNS